MDTETTPHERHAEGNLHKERILAHARWLIEHEQRIKNDAGGWPCSAEHSDGRVEERERVWLSASVQGEALSTLVQAYQLTEDKLYLEAARRTLRTFERDILDGGISTPIGEHGICFEEAAVYPASHHLSGFISALLGLHDYRALIDDQTITTLLKQSHDTLHLLLHEFDIGYWTRVDLLHRRLSSPAILALQIMLLEKLALQSGCERCKERAWRWRSYHRSMGSHVRYLITRSGSKLRDALLGTIQSSLLPKGSRSAMLRICIPITAFPFMGGMRTVLAKVAQVTTDIWQIEYVTQNVGLVTEHMVVHRFGAKKMTPWQFPAVWLYCAAGLRRLLLLLRQGKNYDILLPQDGIFTAAFSGLVGKLAGVRVLCIAADAIVITTICRLSPEKGVGVALGGIEHALSLLPTDLRRRLRFIIAGDGELRWQIEQGIRKRNLEAFCVLWGEIPHEKVLLLHSLSDIYLYTGLRGGGYSLVMLEAMASGCATIASDIPLANEHMLADGRGIVVPAGNMEQTGEAIAQLVRNEQLRQSMGLLARDYVAHNNTAEIFRRVWVRTTYWSELHTLLES